MGFEYAGRFDEPLWYAQHSVELPTEPPLLSARWEMGILESDLSAKLQAARLHFVKFVEDKHLPPPSTAWSISTRLSLAPDSVYPCDSDDQMTSLKSDWLAVVKNEGIVAEDGTFLLSIGGLGRLPWALVMLADAFDIGPLGAYAHEPEFIAMDILGQQSRR